VTVKNISTGEVYSESYDKLILSTGAEPVKPPISGIDSDKVFTLRNIPDTLRIKDYIDEKHPKTAIVVGGGYIGIEMAENLVEAGLEVTLVELADHVIAPLDFDMAAEVHGYIRSNGIRLVLNNGVKEIIDNKDGLSVVLQSGTMESDMLIMSVGVRPETGLAKKARLALNARGAIIVNNNMLTSDQNIYAVGDSAEIEHFITGERAFVPLAGPANKQGRIAADNICGIDSKYTGTQGSSILKLFDMAIAMTGINESTAKANNIDYDKVFLYTGSHASYYPGSTNIWVKVIFEKETGKILGAQVTGFDGVDKRADVLATAIRLGAKADDLTKLELCYAPPFSSAKDPVNMAGYVIENIITGKVKNFHWHDIEALPRDNSVTLLDVRTRGEVRNGMIDGFMNIPLNELRANIDRLDKTKPIYVHCRSGLRSYIACRILAGNGFDAYNLSGGYQLYETVMKEKAH
jgi:NADPH-dependent 2,4-dienoyl-CoA reductase/sulfur reductase-like enzyme/rhodanese-related sulfurtransferase